MMRIVYLLATPAALLAATEPVLTPEPSTWLMLTAGLAGVAFMRRRKNNNKK